jgi:NodT family efflux transporter outer membrane factor (OMF) lipoprotein
MWIVRLALNRPYTFIVVAILILLLSPAVVLRTPTDIFPNIDIPVISAAWTYTGLNPEDLETRLTTPFEKGLTSPTSSVNNGTGDFILPLDLSYEVDLWGRVRRSVASARQQAQASAADLQTARSSLHAEVAVDYFEVRSADAQERLLKDTVKAYSEALRLTQNRFEGGAAPKSDVAQAQTQLQAAQVLASDITVQRAQYEHALAILIGKPSASFHLAVSPLNLVAPALPSVPVTLPARLLERRPDIAAAERRMASANQQVGIAKAAYYPTLNLAASAGLEGSSILNWLVWPSRFWAVGSQPSETLFDAGRRRATTESARAGYDAAVAGYRQTVLDAFQQVEDNLSSSARAQH